jgi:hypothetical protein
VPDVAHTTGIPLPYQLVRNLPFLSLARVPRRFVLLADIALYVLAGAGGAYILGYVRRLGGRLGGRRVRQGLPTATCTGLILLVLLEFAVIPQPLHQVSFSSFFTRLASEPDDFTIMELPVTRHYLRDHARMLNQTVHGRPIVGGYISRQVHDYYQDAPSPFFPFIELNTHPKPDIVPPLDPFAVLNYYHMRYVVVYKEDEGYETPQDHTVVAAYVHYLFPDPAAIVQDDAQLTAYRVPERENKPMIWVSSGWYPAETQNGQTWRWSDGQQASLHVLTQTPLTWHLQFAAASFRGTAHLEIAVNGRAVKTIDIRPDTQSYDAGVIQVPAGNNEISFRTDAPARSPSEVGSNPLDTRKLGFLLTGLQLP